jgi:hypothetical protein
MTVFRISYLHLDAAGLPRLITYFPSQHRPHILGAVIGHG